MYARRIEYRLGSKNGTKVKKEAQKFKWMPGGLEARINGEKERMDARS